MLYNAWQANMTKFLKFILFWKNRIYFYNQIDKNMHKKPKMKN